MQPVKTKKKLSRSDKKQIEAAIARANRTDKKGKSAQDSIPYERMWPDGICRVMDSHYTKTIQFQDINYQLSQNEDKTAIFEGWCDFLNYFDSSIHFQLSFLNLAASEETFANSISIPPQGDAFDSIREEYTTMLQNQLARGNNGLIKTKYLTFGIDADSIKAAKPRLERIETDILNNFKRLGVAARTLDGKERLLIDDATYLHIQLCDSGWDYTMYDKETMKEMDGGQLDMPELSRMKAVLQICDDNDLGRGSVKYAPLSMIETLQEAAYQQIQAEVGQMAASSQLPEAQEQALDEYPMPDEQVSTPDMQEYGYSYDGMLPVTRERALELDAAGLTVYVLHEDNTESMVFDPQEIMDHGGLFGVDREEWEKSPQFHEKVMERQEHQQEREQAFLSQNRDPFIQQVRSDAEQIADAETEQTSEVSISDEEYDAVRRPIPQRTSYDPAAPVYAVGDTVYIEDDAYQITELREDTVQLLPTGMVYPIYRAERKEQFEQLLRADRRNAYYTEFLPIDPDKADQDLRDVLAHGLMDEADKKQISTLLQSGRSNSEIAYWLSRAYSGEIETLNLETGDIADYRTTAQGIELEVMDAEEKRLAMLYFRWDEVAPLLRGMYARQQDGFGQEQPQPATESPTFHSETMAVYPGDKNNLPYDVVVERLHIEEPEPPAPVTEPEKTFEEVLDEHPVSIQVNGEWQTFSNARAAEEAAYGEYKDNLRRTAENFRITDDHLGEGGPKAKFQANIAAIKLLKYLEETTEQATPEQQKILSRYVGWGGLADAFDPEKPAWALEYAQLKELLTPEEYAAARSSTLNAHYTSPTVIQAIYEAVGRMGFETGNILEPSMGVGNFFGMLPEKMRNSRLYGVELDPVSGRIAKQLYPKADITVGGFETTDRRDFFDLAIGNVPFGQYQVNDKAYNKLNFSIHNYFFAKALDQVRPGGVVAFVTSRYTMDAKDSTVRRYLAQRAELLGAIRLPNDAFKKNAGAEVVSDIIFLQKRDRPLDIAPEWTQTGIIRVPAKSQDFVGEGGATEQASFSPQGGNEQAQSATTQDGFAINRYFLEHPEMVLGRQEPVSTAHGMDYTVNPIEGLELSDQLHDAVKYIRGTYQEAELPELGEGEAIDTSIPADPNVKNYSYTVVDGAVYFRENSRMVRPDLNATAEARVKGLVGLRECVQQLIDLQMDAATPDSAIQDKQAELNRLYDSFSAKYGLINDRANRLAFADDSSYYLLCALEVIDEDGRLERKADMFTKRTIKPHKAVDTVDTASEALAVSIAEKACVDMAYMSELTGKTSDELAAELQGVIFRVPGQLEQDGTPHYVTADEYLSGNVRRKLRQAQRAAQQDPAFAANVEALTAAQPKDLDASEIEVRLGATWIDKEYIQQFMYETFDTPFYLQRNIEVNYTPFTAEWQITGKSSVSQNNVAAYTTYGTSRANAYKILEDSLNLRDVRIYDTIEDADGKERRVLNAKETTLAAQKQQAIREAFRDWIWRDPERRQTLVRQYNEEMNSTRPREYDGSHITFGGMNPAITLREHQKSAIAHVLYGGNTLLAHEVGAGKTFEMVAAAMEARLEKLQAEGRKDDVVTFEQLGVDRLFVDEAHNYKNRAKRCA